MLYIYSGEVPELDEALRQALGASHRVTCIPYSPKEVWSADEATDYFRHAGIRARTLSRRFYRDPRRLEQAIMTSDAVYLAGGNTYEFLAYARHMGLFGMLQRFEASGGLIAAESAGSIILCDDIATAAVPSSCPDRNAIGLTELGAMGRIPFHISPHFNPRGFRARADLDELQGLADRSQRPVAVLQDGEGFVMEGERVLRFVGDGRMLMPRLPVATDLTAHAAPWQAFPADGPQDRQ